MSVCVVCAVFTSVRVMCVYEQARMCGVCVCERAQVCCVCEVGRVRACVCCVRVARVRWQAPMFARACWAGSGWRTLSVVSFPLSTFSGVLSRGRDTYRFPSCHSLMSLGL